MLLGRRTLKDCLSFFVASFNSMIERGAEEALEQVLYLKLSYAKDCFSRFSKD